MSKKSKIEIKAEKRIEQLQKELAETKTMSNEYKDRLDQIESNIFLLEELLYSPDN